MNSAKELVYKVRKHRTIHEYVTRQCKVRWKTAATVNGPVRSRPNPDVGSDRDNDFADGTGAAANFVSTSHTKIEFLKKNERHACHGYSSTVLCNIRLMTVLVCGVTCPSCREHKLAVCELGRVARRAVILSLTLRQGALFRAKPLLHLVTTVRARETTAVGACGMASWQM